MAKIFKTSADVAEIIESKWDDTSLAPYGICLRMMSVTKSKEMIKVSKASAATDFLTNEDGTIQLFVYEEAFDRLPDDVKAILVEGALSNVAYDSEKDKIIIDTSKYGEILRMRKKYANYVDMIESAELLIQQIEEEQKEKKEEEKQAKKNKNN